MIQQGRFTAKHEDDLVIFLIGMRVNNWLKFREWLPVFRAMLPMIEYLYQHPERGFLSVDTQISIDFRQVTMIQYWRSHQDLERFARQDPNLHPEAWKNFFKYAYRSQSVGIWHETYQVKAGAYESIYSNMPLHGLAKATKAVPIKEKSA
jgi:hypothetical protein